MPIGYCLPRLVSRAQPQLLLALLAVAPAPAAGAGAGNASPAANAPYSGRAERLAVPLDMRSEVWSFLEQRYLGSPDALRALDPLLASRRDEEDLTDVYFDTPTLDLLARQGEARYRSVSSLSGREAREGWRELMQIELQGPTSALAAQAMEFSIKPLGSPTADGLEALAQPRAWDDNHPMLGRVKRSERDELEKRLAELGVEARSMRPTLTLREQRQRIEVLRAGAPFLSVSMRLVSSGLWWARMQFAELALELDAATFAGADEATRRHMESVLEAMLAEIRGRFPELESQPAPTYQKAFAGLERQLPFLRLLVRTSTHDSDGLLLFGILALGVLIAALLVPLRLLPKRARAG